VWTPAAQKAGAEMLSAAAQAAGGLFAAVIRGVARSIASKEPLRETALAAEAAGMENHPSLEMLGKAIGSAAKQLGGEVAESWRDCNDRDHDCVAAIRTARFPRGVGVQVEADGRVTFVYDTHAGDAVAAKAIQTAVTTHYNVIAAAEFLRREGYAVDIQPHDATGGAARANVQGGGGPSDSTVVLSVVGSRQY